MNPFDIWLQAMRQWVSLTQEAMQTQQEMWLQMMAQAQPPRSRPSPVAPRPEPIGAALAEIAAPAKPGAAKKPAGKPGVTKAAPVSAPGKVY